MKNYLILLIALVLSSCISVPKANIVMPECKPKVVKQECPKPPIIRSIPNVAHISIDGDNVTADTGGEQLIRDYAEMYKWQKQYY